MKTLGIYTKDFSLYHDIIKTLRARNLSYVLLNSAKNIPRRIGIILTSEKEQRFFKTGKTIAVDGFENVDHALDIALQKMIGKEIYSRVLIGIDPGERPGIAILGDDILLQKNQIARPGLVKAYIDRILNIYPARETIVRIGHGSLIIRNRIINDIILLKIPIEIVDETSTSQSRFARYMERDKAAAAAIALISGGKVQTKLPLELTRGAIKNIQRKSRFLSEGRYTISEKIAKEVLKGNLSLQEAIEQESTK